MVDTADSKSAEGNLMPVRVRPPLPSKYPAQSEVVQKPLINQGFLLYLMFTFFDTIADKRIRWNFGTALKRLKPTIPTEEYYDTE
jgi:hypothetical protein